MPSNATLLSDSSWETMLPSEALDRIGSKPSLGTLWLCKSTKRRDALKKFSLEQSLTNIAFATFEELAETLLTAPLVTRSVSEEERFSSLTLRVTRGAVSHRRAIRTVLLDASLQRAGAAGTLKAFPHFQTRGFLESVWRTFDEWDASEAVPAGNLSAIQSLAQGYKKVLELYQFEDPRLVDWQAKKIEPKFDCIVIEDYRRSANRWLKLIQSLAGSIPSIVRTDEPDRWLLPETERIEIKKVRTRKSAGISHLVKNLFQVQVERLSETNGLELIDAPGPIGEARMIARRIRELQEKGTEWGRIVVSVRHLDSNARLLYNTFRQYDIPCEEPLPRVYARQPAIRNLLNFLKLADSGWHFRDLSALLRSNYFRPAGLPGDQPHFLRDAELFLRYLGEPSGRGAFERGLDIWSRSPPPPLEDEEMEHRERARMQGIALRSRDFFLGLFRSLDSLADNVRLVEHLEALRKFVADLGMAAALEGWPAEQAIWQDFFALLDALPKSERKWKRAEFLRLLEQAARNEIDATVGRETETSAKESKIRILLAEDAAKIDCDHLFIAGLNEGSFPDLSSSNSLLSDADRERLIEAGIPLDNPKTRLEAERRLFLDLIQTPKKLLILSRPAVDESGQPILPCSFLREVESCFEPGSLPKQVWRMLVESVDKLPYSAAERRVQFAAQARDDFEKADWSWGGDTSATIRQAGVLVKARFVDKIHNSFDGMLATPAIAALLQKRFGPEKVFSPTALERYVGCPFRFLMQDVLNLEPLEEPTEEIEVWRKGMAFHRALSRLHEQLARVKAKKESEPNSPQFREKFEAELVKAIGEYSDSSASNFTKQLWKLEGERLLRLTKNYGPNWSAFKESWRAARCEPEPLLFEKSFGLKGGTPEKPVESSPALTIERQGLSIRIGGKIDRVDTAKVRDDLYFWVIDYKTGSPVSYTAAMFQKMERLQLTLYALAAQRLFFADTVARPIGLAYWFVAHKEGLKTLFPKQRKSRGVPMVADRNEWEEYVKKLEGWVLEIATRIRSGMYPLAPREKKTCESCPYSQVCRISQSRNGKKDWSFVPE